MMPRALLLCTAANMADGYLSSSVCMVRNNVSPPLDTPVNMTFVVAVLMVMMATAGTAAAATMATLLTADMGSEVTMVVSAGMMAFVITLSTVTAGMVAKLVGNFIVASAIMAMVTTVTTAVMIGSILVIASAVMAAVAALGDSRDSNVFDFHGEFQFLQPDNDRNG